MSDHTTIVDAEGGVSSSNQQQLDEIRLSPPHRLAVFDQFLQNVVVSSRHNNDSNASNGGAVIQQNDDKRLDEVLRVADFLFGELCLDGAVQVLEQNNNSAATLVTPTTSATTTTGRNNNSQSSNVDGAVCCQNVRRFQSPRQHLYLIESSASTFANRRALSNDAYYLCIVPEINNNDNCCSSNDEDKSGQETCAHDNNEEECDDQLYYCSCRTFLERNVATTDDDSSSSSVSGICKHILALKLMPALGMIPFVQTFDTEEEFGRAVARKLYPDVCF